MYLIVGYRCGMISTGENQVEWGKEKVLTWFKGMNILVEEIISE